MKVHLGILTNQVNQFVTEKYAIFIIFKQTNESGADIEEETHLIMKVHNGNSQKPLRKVNSKQQ